MDWPTIVLILIGVLFLSFFLYHLVQIASGREKTGDDADREISAAYWRRHR